MTESFQSGFASSLLDPHPILPPGLVSHNLVSPPKRFGVYRNNVRTSLTEALASRFPVTRRIVGADFFAAMAQEFIRISPPRSPVLLTYGDSFPDFVDGFEPASCLPYLSDVMRLETARGRAYHAADAPPLSGDELARIAPDDLGNLMLQAHPSLTVLRSAYPVATIWTMNNEGSEPLPIEDWDGEDVLITRPSMLVEVRNLPPGCGTFFQALLDGDTLSGAANKAQGSAEAFDLSIALSLLLQSGAFQGLISESLTP